MIVTIRVRQSQTGGEHEFCGSPQRRPSASSSPSFRPRRGTTPGSGTKAIQRPGGQPWGRVSATVSMSLDALRSTGAMKSRLPPVPEGSCQLRGRNAVTDAVTASSG